jgi:hypothetical protein
LNLDHVPTIDAPAPNAYSAAVLADSPLAYFRLGEQAGVTARDEVAAGPAGTYLGGVALGMPGAIAGDTDTAIACDGNNSAVELGDVFDFAGTVPFSLELWLKPAAFDGEFHDVLSKWQQPPIAIGYDLYYRDNVMGMAREISETSADLVQYFSFTAGEYIHVVTTYDGTKLRIYLDGVERAQAPASRSLPDTATPFMIGSGNGMPTAAPVNGLIDEVAIYGTVLSPERIDIHHRTGLGLL